MKKKERKSNSGQCLALAIIFVLPLRHTRVIFKNKFLQEAAKLDEFFNSPSFKSRSLRPLTRAITSPGSSSFPKDYGVEVANWGCCSNWLTSSQMGNQPTEPYFLAFQENFCQYLHCLFRDRFFIPHFGKVSPAIT